MAKWTFLTNHALVLSYLATTHKITARELSLTIGITERAVRKVIADLADARYIRKKKRADTSGTVFTLICRSVITHTVKSPSGTF